MKGVQKNITNFLKASITTDSVNIFSIAFSTLVTANCKYTCKIAKGRFQTCAVAEMYNVLCY